MWRAARTAVAVAAVGFSLAACGSAGTSSSHSSAAPGATATATSASASAALAVSPTVGGPRTTFTFAFTAPSSSVPVAGSRTGYTVSVTGPGTGSCLGTRSMAVSAATNGTSVSVGLDPARLGGRWCPGEHTVRVTEIETPVCNPGTMCPQFVRVVGTVGVGRFTVAP